MASEKKNFGKKFLSDLKLYSDYFKWREDLGRYENWEEACEDIVNGHKKRYSNADISCELDLVLELMKSKTILASQRNLQFRHEQIMKHNMRMFNCCTLHFVSPRNFGDVLYLGLCGCGVGSSLLLPFINQLPEIQKREKGTKTYVIPDTIEGWKDAVNVLMSSYFTDNQVFPEYSGYNIRFDYSQIREVGSFISGGFKAPGSNGLKNSLESIEKLLDNWLVSQGPKLRPIAVFDILCHSSDAVLSGGVRRSALSMLVDPNDTEMMFAKTGNWRTENPQRGRSNNSVLIHRQLCDENEESQRKFFDSIVEINDGANDLGFVFCNTWFDVFNPCFEIGFTPVDTHDKLQDISYENVEEWTRQNIHLFGIQACNLNEINAEKCVPENGKTLEESFLRACEAAAILGTLQAGYTDFPFLSHRTEKLVRREALLGVSITGWMNNPALFNEELLRKGAAVVMETNKKVAQKIGINPAARATCVKPSGNASVVLMTESGIHAGHSLMHFRIMQLNKVSDTAKFLEQEMPFLLEESVWSKNNTDYVVFVPIVNPENGLFKKDMKGVKHLELIKLVQNNWIVPGTNRELGICNLTNHNCSCTVIIDDSKAVTDYIWNNRRDFTAVSFISDYGDKDFNQAPFTSVMNFEEIASAYGKGSMFASGLIVDGLHYFNNNLWNACDCLMDKTIPVSGTREQVLLKKDWIRRAKQFAKNYFKNDIKRMIYCLKDVHLFHKWESINRQMKEISLDSVLNKPSYKDVSEYAAVACSGGSCEITRLN
jgi:ribonucleoside-diphosphate reductase alpha chain